MEIKSRAGVAAKPWPALSGHSPMWHRAHPSPAWPQELGNGRDWASSSSIGHTGLTQPGHNQRTLVFRGAHWFLGKHTGFQGSTAAAAAFSDNICSSTLESWNCFCWKRLLRSLKITKFIKPPVQSPAASKPKTSQAVQGQLSSTQGAMKQQLRDAKA